MKERKREGDGQFFYHERWLLFIAAEFKSDLRLSSSYDGVTATREEFSDDCPEASFSGVAESVSTGAWDDKGDWDFRYMPLGSSPGREHRLMVLSNVQGFVICVELLTLDNALNVSCIAKCAFWTGLRSWSCVECCELAGEESRMAEVGRLEEHVSAAEENSEALRVAHACVDEVTGDG